MNLTELKRHAKKVGNTFFSKGNARYFNSSRVFGVYRQPYSSATEGYVIAETIFIGSDGVAASPEYVIYRFEATPDTLEWNAPIGKHSSVKDAEAFLKAQGIVK